MLSASTSVAQMSNTVSQHEFLFSTPMSHTKKPYNFMQETAHQVFPHTSIAYNYSPGDHTPVVSASNSTMGRSVEEEEEISHS